MTDKSPEEQLSEHEKFINQSTLELRNSALRGILQLREKYGMFGAERHAEYELFSRTVIACDIFLMEENEFRDESDTD